MGWGEVRVVNSFWSVCESIKVDNMITEYFTFVNVVW